MTLLKHLLLSLFIVLVTSQAALAADVRLSFRQSPVVGHAQVRLGDIALVQANDRSVTKELQALVLGDAPLPGYKQAWVTWQVDRLLMQAMSRREVRREVSWEWRGLAETQLTAIGEPIAVDRLVSAAEDGLTKLLVEQGYADVAVQAVNVASIRPIHVPRGQLQLRVGLSDRVAPRHRMRIPLQVYVDNELEAAVSIWLQVSAMQQVAVVTRSMPKGAVLDSNDVTLQLRDVATVNGSVITSVQRAVGQRVRIDLPRDVVVSAQALQVPKAVHRGEKTLAVVIYEGIQIQAPVKSMQDGDVGDVIRVRSLSSGESFYAEVIAAGQVAVLD